MVDGEKLPLDAPSAESAGHKDAVDVLENGGGLGLFKFFRVHLDELHTEPACDSSVHKGVENGAIGVLKRHVFAA